MQRLGREHIRELDAATFDARVRIYALRPEPMADLLRWLAEAERLWSEQLTAFKAHLERKLPPKDAE